MASFSSHNIVVIKLSGEALNLKNKENKPVDIFNNQYLQKLALVLKKHCHKWNFILICGGGNIWRGSEHPLYNLESSHHIGMFATTINGVMLCDYFAKENIPHVHYSRFLNSSCVPQFTYEQLHKALKNNCVVVISGGTGIPYVSTDSATALIALETKTKLIIWGKNNVDGIYTNDPLKYPKQAKFIKKMTYKEYLDMKLNVIDVNAMTMIAKTNIKNIVLNINDLAIVDNWLSGKNTKVSVVVNKI